MNTFDVVAQFDQHDMMPCKAILSAIEHKEEVKSSLLAFFKNSINNNNRDQATAFQITLALLAQFRESAAFNDLIALLEMSEDVVEDMLGVFIDELPTLLVSLYNGNLAALKRIIENEELVREIRAAALSALLGLFAIEKISRVELIAYYKQLLSSPLVNDEDFATLLVEEIYSSYPKELEKELLAMIESGKTASLFVTKESIEEALNESSQEEHLNVEVYSNPNILPLFNALPLIDNLYEDDMSEEELEDFMATLELDEEESEDDNCCSSDDQEGCC